LLPRGLTFGELSSKALHHYVSVFLVLLVTAPFISNVPVKAYTPKAAGTAFFGGEQDDVTYSIAQTADGGYVLAGYTKSYGAGGSDMWLIKSTSYSFPLGNVPYDTTQWNRTYGGQDDGAKCVIQTGDGGYALAGYTNSSVAGGYDMWLVKTDASGNVEWNRNYDGQTGDNVHFARAYSLIQTGPGDFRMAGAQEMLHAETFGMTAWANDGILVRVTLNTDSTPPTITILSPESNKTYAPDSIPLTFYVSNSTVWIGYCLDNGLNVTIAGNTTLPTLPEGQHNITVFASDTSYNAGASDTVYFSSETIYFTITQNAVLETPPPQTTSPTSPTESSEPLPVAGIAVGATLVAAGGVAGLVYFQKSRKIREHQR
jgi:hypothetical protein